MHQLKSTKILWLLKNERFGKIYLGILLILVLIPVVMGIILFREKRIDQQFRNYGFGDITHYIGQLRRETLRLHILILKIPNQVTEEDLSQQLALLESRVNIMQNDVILSFLDPTLLNSIDEFERQWQLIRQNSQKIITKNITSADLKKLEESLTKMDLIVNTIARENDLYIQFRQERLMHSREVFLFVLIAFYGVFLVILVAFLNYSINSTLAQQKTLLSLNISQQRYRKIVETAEEGIWILNNDKNIVFLNSKLLSSLKESMENIIGSSAYLLCDSEATKKNLEQHFNEVDRHQSAHIDICVINHENTPLWFYINSTLIDLNNEGDQHILSMLTDITKRKQIEEELTKANERLTHQANFDELTQIANRRYFNLYAMKIWRQALQSQREFSLALIDIDYFKKYNDHYGHLQGDICLFQIAQVISASAQREHDLAARYGGEEFVLLLPDTSQLEAIKIVENLQSHITALGIEHRMSLVGEMVTLSIGVVTGIPRGEISIEDALRIADEALYDAKEHGRNQYRIQRF